MFIEKITREQTGKYYTILGECYCVIGVVHLKLTLIEIDKNKENIDAAPLLIILLL